MLPIRSLSRAALVAALALLAAACGGDDGSRPDAPAVPLDPQVVETSMAKLASVVDQPVLRALFAVSNPFDGVFVPFAVGGPTGPLSGSLGADPRSNARRSPTRLSAAAAGASTLSAAGGPSIPVGSRGRVHIYDRALERWVPDASRTGAPANGVRLVVGPTVGDAAAAVAGFVDVQDLGTTAVSRLVTTVRNAAGVVAMTFDERTSGPLFGPGYADSVDGQVVKGTDVLTFFMYESYDAAGIGDRLTERSKAGFSLPSAELSQESGFFSRNAPGDSNYTVTRIGGRTMRFTNRHVPDPEFPDFYTLSDTTRLFLDDRLYALVIYPSGLDSEDPPRLVSPGGTPLPAAEEATIMRQQAAEIGVVPLFFIPLMVFFWIDELTPPATR